MTHHLARFAGAVQIRAGELHTEVYLQTKALIVGLAIAAVLLPATATFAAPIDTTALNTGVNSIVGSIQAICIISLPLLFIAGFGVLMYSGFSDKFRTVAIRIIGFAFAGALGLFLFALPIAGLVTSSVGCTPGAAGGAATCPGH